MQALVDAMLGRGTEIKVYPRPPVSRVLVGKHTPEGSRCRINTHLRRDIEEGLLCRPRLYPDDNRVRVPAWIGGADREDSKALYQVVEVRLERVPPSYFSQGAERRSRSFGDGPQTWLLHAAVVGEASVAVVVDHYHCRVQICKHP